MHESKIIKFRIVKRAELLCACFGLLSFACHRTPVPVTIMRPEGVILFESKVESVVNLKLPAEEFKPLVAVFCSFANKDVKIQKIMGQEIIGIFKFNSIELEWGGDDFWIYDRNTRVWQFYKVAPNLAHPSVDSFLRNNKKISESEWLEILGRWKN